MTGGNLPHGAVLVRRSSVFGDANSTRFGFDRRAHRAAIVEVVDGMQTCRGWASLALAQDLAAVTNAAGARVQLPSLPFDPIRVIRRLAHGDVRRGRRRCAIHAFGTAIARIEERVFATGYGTRNQAAHFLAGMTVAVAAAVVPHLPFVPQFTIHLARFLRRRPGDLRHFGGDVVEVRVRRFNFLVGAIQALAGTATPVVPNVPVRTLLGALQRAAFGTLANPAAVGVRLETVEAMLVAIVQRGAAALADDLPVVVDCVTKIALQIAAI